MFRVFIAHAKASEGALAAELAAKLRVAGMRVFFDEDSLPPGEEYDLRITREIRDCDLMVFLISAQSVTQGRYTLTELAIAKRRWKNHRRRVLGVVAADVDVALVDPYLRATTLLRPRGDVAGDTLQAVLELRRQTRIQRIAVMTAPAVIVPAVVVGWYLLQSHPTSLASGSYRCTSDDVSFSQCEVAKLDGRLVLRFDGPGHSESELVDTYSCAAEVTGAQLTCILRNEFNANPGVDSATVNTSSLRLKEVTTGRWEGTWEPGDGSKSRPFSMRRLL